MDPSKGDLLSVGVVISKGFQGFESVMLCGQLPQLLGNCDFPWDTCKNTLFLLFSGKKFID